MFDGPWYLYAGKLASLTVMLGLAALLYELTITLVEDTRCGHRLGVMRVLEGLIALPLFFAAVIAVFARW